jgi:hypothetical protein
MAYAHHDRTGPLLVEGHGKERIALVVAQTDVEAGPMLLDERELENQRFHFVANRHPLDRLGGGHHLGRAGMEQRRVLEVVRQALAQTRRLAHVDHAAVRVLELVRARSIGNARAGRSLHHVVSLNTTG